jgi:hypothetical protein
MTLKGRVKAGRLIVDEPTNLPETPKWNSCPSIPETGSTTKLAPRCIVL